jgi:hypothetical protein
MSVLPGELQAEEEEKTFLGVREYELDKDADSDNLMFRDLQNERNTDNGDGRSQRRGSKDNPQTTAERNDAEDLERELAARRAARIEAQRTESQQGSHTVSALDFKGLLANSPLESGRSELSLREVLGGVQQQPNKGQQALRDEFKAFLNGQANSASGSGALSDPANSWRNDFTRQPMHPTIGKAPESARNHNTTFATPGFAPSQNNPFAAKAFDESFSRSAIPGLPSTALTPPAQAPTRTFAAPPANRGLGMNSLGGHSR